jgi:hypothetical protein
MNYDRGSRSDRSHREISRAFALRQLARHDEAKQALACAFWHIPVRHRGRPIRPSPCCAQAARTDSRLEWPVKTIRGSAMSKGIALLVWMLGAGAWAANARADEAVDIVNATAHTYDPTHQLADFLFAWLALDCR